MGLLCMCGCYSVDIRIVGKWIGILKLCSLSVLVSFGEYVLLRFECGISVIRLVLVVICIVFG